MKEERVEHETLLKTVDWIRLERGWGIGGRLEGTKDPLTLG